MVNQFAGLNEAAGVSRSPWHRLPIGSWPVHRPGRRRWRTRAARRAAAVGPRRRLLALLGNEAGSLRPGHVSGRPEDKTDRAVPTIRRRAAGADGDEVRRRAGPHARAPHRIPRVGPLNGADDGSAKQSPRHARPRRRPPPGTVCRPEIPRCGRRCTGAAVGGAPARAGRTGGAVREQLRGPVPDAPVPACRRERPPVVS
ncbi:hypothetical protein ACVWWN_001306 [Mycobacterium sp. URHB0021]